MATRPFERTDRIVIKVRTKEKEVMARSPKRLRKLLRIYLEIKGY